MTADIGRDARFGATLFDALRVLIVGGIPAGVLVAGLGSRLAMLVLRMTSPDGVNGIESDDGFTIGRFTLGGTYNLMLIGAAVGLIGAGAYLMVRRWLIGPPWFRRLTVGLAAGVVVGSMLVHADGVDFTVLEPTWLAVSLFVVLPGCFGVVVGAAVDAVERPGSWTRRGWRHWVLPIVLVACFPAVLPILVIATVVLAVWIPLRDTDAVARVRGLGAWKVTMRATWLAIAVLGLVALVNDVGELA